MEIRQLDQPTYLKDRQGTPAGRRQPGLRALVMRLPGCRRDDLAAVPQRKHLVEYANPDFDKLVDAARGTLDANARLAAYHSAFEILRQDVPWIGLYQADALYAAQRNLEWQPTPNEAFFIMDMKWQ